MNFQKVVVNSPNCQYFDNFILSNYEYNCSQAKIINNELQVSEKKIHLKFKTEKEVPTPLGVMLVGLGGNNGTTFVATILTHKNNYTWKTKEKLHKPNWYGSITQSSTVRMGITEEGDEYFAPMSMLVPMVEPTNIIVDGWDISGDNLGVALEKAQVLDVNLQSQLKEEMSKITPKPAIYYPDFIASNQKERANNILKGTKQEHLIQLRNDIKSFKLKNNLKQVIILWTANTERFCQLIPGHNDTAENLLNAISQDKDEISPSTMYAVAAILENCIYINGSPQNTFVPGVIELAQKYNVCIAGDDFKSGQTKLKSVLVDFLVTAGIKPVSIVSYNHLGNNDGKNLSAPDQFRSKEITKSNVVDDMVHSNRILYPSKEDKPDHTIVIKYVPYVGDSKRALDEYTSEILLDGHNTIVVHNTCEDSLLATPIMLDLILLSELFSRVRFSREGEENYQKFHSILSVLGYLLKAPLTPAKAPVVNSLYRQRACIENILRALIGLAPENSMLLEYKLNL